MQVSAKGTPLEDTKKSESSIPVLNLSFLSVEERIEFLRTANIIPKSNDKLDLGEQILQVVSTHFVQRWINNRYTIDYPENLYTEAMHYCVLAEIYRQNQYHYIHQLESANLSLLLSEDNLQILKLGDVLGVLPNNGKHGGLNIKDMINNSQDWFETIRHRCIRVLTAANKVNRTLFSDKRAQHWDYPFPKKYCPENESQILLKFNTPLSIHQEIKYTGHTTDHILARIPKEAKFGDILRDPNTKKIYLLGQGRIYSPKFDDRMLREFYFPKIPIGYWADINPKQTSWWADLSKYTESIWSKMRGPVNSYRGIEHRSYFIYDGMRYNLSINDLSNLDLSLVKLTLRSDGYYQIESLK